MKLLDEFEPIREWAYEKGILTMGDRKTQCLKLAEEVGELSKAVIENNQTEIIDGIGDCVVVLTSLANMSGYTIEECINKAYEEIMNRKGKMINNTFIKE